MSPATLDVVVQAEAWGDKNKWLALFMPAAQAALHTQPDLQMPLHACVLLSDDTRIAFHNKQWRGKAEPTNVLSFPSPKIIRNKGFLGDIIMSIETLRREAQNQQKPLNQHALHLFLHGFLHLLGHEHGSEADAQVMENFEKKILLELGQPDPYD